MEEWQDGRMEVRVEQKYGMALLGFRSFASKAFSFANCVSVVYNSASQISE